MLFQHFGHEDFLKTNAAPNKTKGPYKNPLYELGSNIAFLDEAKWSASTAARMQFGAPGEDLPRSLLDVELQFYCFLSFPFVDA